MRIYRTKIGGSVFFLNRVLPCEFSALINYSDTLADSSLREQYIPPIIGKEHDLPPKASMMCLHQGLIAYAGIKSQPNTIAFSTIDGVEYVPLASNYFDIPSNITGAVSAIGSDTEDRLAAFKNTAYYDVAGDLDSNNFTVRTVKEGDYGVSSHSSLVKTNGLLMGLGRLGFVAVQNGQLDKKIGWRIAPVFWNNNNIAFHQAIAVNDYTSRHYHCYIPNATGFGSGIDNTNALMYSFDYDNGGLWFDKSYSAGIAPAGGMSIYNNVKYHLSKNYGPALSNQLPGRLFRELIGLSDQTQQFADNHLAINYDWLTNFDPLDEPALYKEYLWIGVYSFVGNYETATPFSLLVTTYKNFDNTNLHSQATLTFSGIRNDHQRFRAKADKVTSMAYRFTCNTIGQAPYITGLEMVVAASYIKDNPAK